MAYIGYDISRGLQDVLRKNGLEAHIEMDPNGDLYLAAEGRHYRYNRYKITEQQADILSRWLDMGTGSTNNKAYNTLKNILKDADMPANLTIAQQAGGMVNMGQWGQHMTPERMGWTPKQGHGKYYSNREMVPGLFPMHGMAPTFPGERLAPGTMRSFDYRSGGRLLPTTGVYQKAPEAGRMLPENNDLLDDIELNAEVNKPEEARYPAGEALPLSEAMPLLAKYPNSDVYFSLESFKKVMASHGLTIGEHTADGQTQKGIIVSNSASRVDKLFYSLTDEEMAALLNPSIDERSGGVSIQSRLDIINGKAAFRKDFDGEVTIQMLESRDINNIPLTPTGKAEIEKDFIAYDAYIERQRMLDEARSQAREEYLAEEGRIRRDPNAISGRDLAAVMGSYAWFNGTAHGREVVVGEIRVEDYYTTQQKNLKQLDENIARIRQDIDRLRQTEDDPNKAEKIDRMQQRLQVYQKNYEEMEKNAQEFAKENAKGRYVMTAMINGEHSAMAISKSDYEKFLAYDDRHRLELFDKVFDKVSIEPVDSGRFENQGKPYDIFLTADGREIVTREQLEISRSQSIDVDGGNLKDLNFKRGFYREGRHGREVNVENIHVERDAQQEGKFRMTAVIDGKAITHEISQKQYDKFLACDDYHRMKLFAKIFNEVDLKVRPEHRANIGAMIVAGLTTGLRTIGDIMRPLYGPGPHIGPHPFMHPESVHFAPSAPAVFEERIPGPPPHHTRAADIAAASYEAEAGQQQTPNQGVGQGRGMST